jgi:hypothetical protein
MRACLRGCHLTDNPLRLDFVPLKRHTKIYFSLFYHQLNGYYAKLWHARYNTHVWYVGTFAYFGLIDYLKCLNIKAIFYFELLIPTYTFTRRHNPERHHGHHPRDNPILHKYEVTACDLLRIASLRHTRGGGGGGRPLTSALAGGE